MASEVKTRSNRPCPCCGDRVYRPKPLFDNVIECNNRCGMTYADTEKTQADFDAYYSQPGRYTPEWSAWNHRRYVQQARRIAGLMTNKDAHIVDIGGAEGGLAAAVVREGFTCVELYRHPGAQLTGIYDLAILSHVLEHVLDVKGLLDNVNKRTKHLYVEVPDARRYHVGEASPYQQFNEEHINHWDMVLLLETLSNAGFSVRACGESTCDPNDFPVIWAYAEANQSKLVDAIRLYCDKSAQLMAKIERQIAAIEGPVICWGVGALARRLELMLEGKVVASIDARSGGSYCGKPVLQPKEEYSSDVPILITTILHKDSVFKQIEGMELKNPVITLGD